MFQFLKSRRTRRREPEFRLEARLRSAAKLRRRRASLRLIPWLLFAVVLIGGTVTLLDVARHQWLYRVPAFSLSDIEILRDGPLTEQEILATASVRRGMNTLALDLPAIQQRLHRHPRIERAELRRALPDHLRISIRERSPVARVRPSNASLETPLDAFYLLDDKGFILLPFRPGQAPAEILETEASLPIVVGVVTVTTNFIPGRAISDDATLAALRLLAAFETSSMAGLTDVLTVDVSQPGDVTATTSTGSRITFGRRDFDPDFTLQLRRWQAVHLDSLRQSRIISTLDLGVYNNAPLRWFEEGQAPPPTPVTPKPKRAKIQRRHV